LLLTYSYSDYTHETVTLLSTTFYFNRRNAFAGKPMVFRLHLQYSEAVNKILHHDGRKNEITHDIQYAIRDYADNLQSFCKTLQGWSMAQHPKIPNTAA